ncbi:unnamed protein product, partial [Ranitomeya imitator]
AGSPQCPTSAAGAGSPQCPPLLQVPAPLGAHLCCMCRFRSVSTFAAVAGSAQCRPLL